MKLAIQPMFPGQRRNSPRHDTMCSDLAGLTTLPPALFVADEAGLTVSSSEGWTSSVRALIGVGADDEFSSAITLICTMPEIGTIVIPHEVDLSGSVNDVMNGCAIRLAVALVEGRSDPDVWSQLTILDYQGNVLAETPF